MRFEWISLSKHSSASPPESNIICLGNFDGVHLGHRALLARALRFKEDFPSAACGVFCFRELPVNILSKKQTPHLSTLGQKAELFREAGMDFMILASFEDLQAFTPERFVREILQEECRAVAAVCGFNYHFGVHGSGDAHMLQKLLFPTLVATVDEVCALGETVSSSRIRMLLAQGMIEEANMLLARPFSFTAPVLHGKALGRHLGAPTINQHFPHGFQIPLHGVYVTECEIDGRAFRGVSNVGTHPTVDDMSEVNCETYLFDFSGILYGKEIKTSFLSFLRPEQKFESREALSEQIARDIQAAKNNR